MHIDTPKATDGSLEERDHLWNLIKDIRFAMFTARHGNGHLHSRPMTTQNQTIDEEASLWFFMARGHEPVSDLARDAEVNVAYADPGSDRYVSVSGRAEVVEDTGMKQRLWTTMSEAWFPGGVDDPNLALVRVRITHASYWDVKDSKLVQVFKMARAVVTGHPPQDMGDRGDVRLRE